MVRPQLIDLTPLALCAIGVGVLITLLGHSMCHPGFAGQITSLGFVASSLALLLGPLLAISRPSRDAMSPVIMISFVLLAVAVILALAAFQLLAGTGRHPAGYTRIVATMWFTTSFVGYFSGRLFRMGERPGALLGSIIASIGAAFSCLLVYFSLYCE